MDRVSGPYKGYWVASCALPMGELGDKFIGYAKVCSSRPRGCWDAPAVFEHSPEQLCNAADDAMAKAEAGALRRIDELPRAGERRGRREGPG